MIARIKSLASEDKDSDREMLESTGSIASAVRTQAVANPVRRIAVGAWPNFFMKQGGKVVDSIPGSVISRK